MDSLRLIVGVFYLLSPLILLPIYVRILYIFASKKEYRALECYRIMILIGVVQCVTTPPGFILAGVVHLLDYDPYGIAAAAIKIYPGGFRAEAMLSLVLALNRLRIICGLHYPELIHKVLMGIAFVIGVTFTSLLFSPLCEYRILPGHYLMEYDLSIPSCRTIQLVGSYFLTGPSFLSLLVYSVITIYLIKTKLKTGVHHGSSEERRIFLYAVTRFAIEFSLVGTYHYGKPPHYPQYDIPINVGLMFTALLVPPVLYIILYRSVRKEFFPCKNALIDLAKVAAHHAN
ncbi:hypothetical protein QR680_010202 [Steinernema hermaphroditum]|uniref:Uncharacterized protein n=1 Tax=Steinernema hermaphroditum TaxID=289476 RepID=A0AA39MB49_9BILA|nr:hypothetical protein QR680_010202 [Steinernema hermaphroditum]